MPKTTMWVELLTPLMAHGRWAVVKAFDTRNAAYVAASELRRGARDIPAGQWRFKAVSTPEDATGGVLFARYLGPAE